MSGLKLTEGDTVVNICVDDTDGEIIEIAFLKIQLPKRPAKKDILFHDKPKKDQRWERTELPRELASI